VLTVYTRKARLNAQNWQPLIDECEQCSGTLNPQRERVPILRELKTLRNVLQGSGRVFLADADLDLSIDLRERSGAAVEPWVVE